jgi:hypothetical protein
MCYFIYENLRNFFSDYNNSTQIDIFDPYLTYELDMYSLYTDNNNYNFILPIVFVSYVIISSFYINRIKSAFKRQLLIYNEKLSKIQNEKKNAKKKYQNLMISIKRIKEISSTEDRSAKKVCLISSELRNNFKG